jgi:hypothetical protein
MEQKKRHELHEFHEGIVQFVQFVAFFPEVFSRFFACICFQLWNPGSGVDVPIHQGRAHFRGPDIFAVFPDKSAPQQPHEIRVVLGGVI